MRQARRPFRGIAVTLFCALFLVTGGTNLAQPVVRTEQTVLDEAPPPLAEEGPAAGAFTEAWRTSLTLPESARFALAGANVVTGTQDEVFALDARTGELTWRYREPERRIGYWTATPDTVVVGSTGKAGKHELNHLVGLDAATGKLLWEKHDSWSIDPQDESFGGAPILGGEATNNVIVVNEGESIKRGIEATTGETLWSLSAGDLPDECTLRANDVWEFSGDQLIVTIACPEADDSRSRYGAVAAESGKPLWFSDKGDGDFVAMRGGFGIRVGPNQSPVILGRDGGELFTAAEAESRCPCAVVEGSEGTLLGYRSAADDGTSAVGRVVTIGPGGHAEPVATLPGFRPFQLYTATNERLYSVSATRPDLSDEPYLPVAAPLLLTTITGNGDVEHSTLPTAIPGFTERKWFAAAGDQVFLATLHNDGNDGGETVVRSFSRTGDAAVPGGVDAVDAGTWPDACTLLSGLPQSRPDQPPGEEVRVGDVTLPPTSCVGSAERPDVVNLDVVWVASTEDEAAKLLTDIGAGKDTAFGADQEHDDGKGTVVLRAGSVIVTVTVEDIVGEAQREDILRDVVTNLRELG
ncbi:PQQ-binding-like beta-propeller repeat protein [Saccharomonospora sp. NPDC006951]